MPEQYRPDRVQERPEAGVHSYDLLRDRGERHHWTREARIRTTQDILADLTASGLSPQQLALVMELSIAVASDQPARTARQERNARYYEKRKAERLNKTQSV
jgi:hypothetical protein